jgi:ATP phosphoribosyltransferase
LLSNLTAAAQLPDLEVWFQRASDVVRKLVRGDLDLGIVGADMFEELAAGSPDLIVLHGALDFGHCHLGLGVPTGGRWAGVTTLEVSHPLGFRLVY